MMLTYVPRHIATPVIWRLIEDGYLPAYIEEVTGVPAVTIQRVVDGRQSKMRTDKFDDMTRVRLGSGQDNLVDATGTTRRVRSLMRDCWSTSEIAAATGVGARCVRGLAEGTDMVRASTAWAVDELYRSHPPVGPNPEVGDYARAQGWVPGEAWDDIDDPLSEPCREHDRAVRWMA